MPHALQFLVLTLSGWLNHHQEDLIDYLREENRVLREQLGSATLSRTLGIRSRVTPSSGSCRITGSSPHPSGAAGRPGRPSCRLTGKARLPPRSPNLNAYAERFVRSIKEECLHRVVLLSESHLRLVIQEYVEHYHRERNHQGLNNQLLERAPQSAAICNSLHRFLGAGKENHAHSDSWA